MQFRLFNTLRLCALIGVFSIVGMSQCQVVGQELSSFDAKLRGSLSFLASFDAGVDADFGRGDRRLYTTKAYATRKDAQPGNATAHVRHSTAGKWGGGLQFGEKSEVTVFYQGKGNVAYAPSGFSGTVSVWMSLSPDEDLAPGYVDPLQITDKEWNNACLFFDFTKDDKPRHFRAAAFSDLKYWNPTNQPWESVAVKDRPMIVAERPPFKRGQWTHVVLTYENFNREQPGIAKFYLNGNLIGELKKDQRFSWDESKLAILLGIYYTGLMDDFAIFDSALSEQEVKQIYQRPTSLTTLVKKG